MHLNNIPELWSSHTRIASEKQLPSLGAVDKKKLAYMNTRAVKHIPELWSSRHKVHQ
jgi:hypothetical protein